MSKKNIKNKIDKAKELYDNIDEQEKEAIKEAGKEVVELVKEAIEQKKETGKVDRGFMVSIAASIIALFSIVYTAVQPDTTVYVDNAIDSVEVKIDSVNSLLEAKNATSDSLKVKLEETEKVTERFKVDRKGSLIIE